ncbi:MAG: hypothetical protein LBI05_05820 [Planctomycetaceae bacterium]|nr:hypothetical protein [Planctomycetaceae bacterium]
MSRAYRMVASLEVDAKLSDVDYAFWQDVLYRCLEEPTDVIEGLDDQYSRPEDVEIQTFCEGKTQFYLDIEQNLCGGCSEDEFAEDFRKAVHRLTKDVSQDFRVSLSLYYLGHDPDLYMSFDRQELAA